MRRLLRSGRNRKRRLAETGSEEATERRMRPGRCDRGEKGRTLTETLQAALRRRLQSSREGADFASRAPVLGRHRTPCRTKENRIGTTSAMASHAIAPGRQRPCASPLTRLKHSFEALAFAQGA